MKSLKVGIIGAGIAGLSCAHQLTLAGHEVVIFDKSHGVGGRMSHRNYEKWGADHGAQYFTAKDPLFAEEVQRWIQAGVASSWLGKIVSYTHGQIVGSDPTKKRYVGVPEMSSPAKYLAKNVVLELSQTITEITKINGYWEVSSKESGVLPHQFDFLICATPPAQAKNLIGKNSQNLQVMCSEVQMQPCWTFLAYLRNPLTLDFDGAFINDHIFSWIARDNTKPERSRYETWVAQANPAWSEEHLDLSHYEVEPLLIEAFQNLTGAECDLYQTHLWRYAKLENESQSNYGLDTQNQLALCGDWLRTSTVEGAWMSGFHLAKVLNRMYS